MLVIAALAATMMMGISNVYLDLCYFVCMFTAGRGGKDGRAHTVQSFPLFSIGFGGLL
jgi:hypothetical protein